MNIRVGWDQYAELCGIAALLLYGSLRSRNIPRLLPPSRYDQSLGLEGAEVYSAMGCAQAYCRDSGVGYGYRATCKTGPPTTSETGPSGARRWMGLNENHVVQGGGPAGDEMRTPDEVAAMLRLKTLGWPPSRATVRLQGSAEVFAAAPGPRRCALRPLGPRSRRRSAETSRDIFARTRLLTCSAGSVRRSKSMPAIASSAGDITVISDRPARACGYAVLVGVFVLLVLAAYLGWLSFGRTSAGGLLRW